MKGWLKTVGNVQPLLPAAIQLHSILSNKGAQGVVYQGTVNGADAAIKVYLPGQVHKRVEREVKALSKLNCPSIVRLLWDGSVTVGPDQLPVVATQLVPGEELSEVLKKAALSSDALGKLAYDVAAAIQELWNARIVHRDLKPDNILMQPTGRACVIDLGVARHVDESSITAVGVTWGTYGYFSPEQTRAVRKLTCKSDLFSLGILLVEAAEGAHPTNRDQYLLLSRKLHQNLPPKVKAWKHASLVRELLDPLPARRPLPSAILDKLKEYVP